MLKYFGADVYLDSIYGLTPEFGKARHPRSDNGFDNTVAAYNTILPDDKVMEWFKTLRQAGFRLRSSRTTARRASAGSACPSAYRISGRAESRARALSVKLWRKSAKPEYTAMVGDKLLTDVWGAWRCGITAILVKPVGGRGIITI